MSINIAGEKQHAIFICCYAPTLVADNQTKQRFYEQLKRHIDQVPNTNNIIIAGDMDARIGKGEDNWKHIIGNHGIGQRNENGQLLLELCAEKNLHIANTRFKPKNMHKVTWKHPRSREWHILDYIIVRSNNIRDVLRCRRM